MCIEMYDKRSSVSREYSPARSITESVLLMRNSFIIKYFYKGVCII